MFLVHISFDSRLFLSCASLLYQGRMADEKERFHRALDFMKMLGISQSVVAPVLRRLIKVCRCLFEKYIYTDCFLTNLCYIEACLSYVLKPNYETFNG